MLWICSEMRHICPRLLWEGGCEGLFDEEGWQHYQGEGRGGHGCQWPLGRAVCLLLRAAKEPCRGGAAAPHTGAGGQHPAHVSVPVCSGSCRTHAPMPSPFQCHRCVAGVHTAQCCWHAREHHVQFVSMCVFSQSFHPSGGTREGSKHKGASKKEMLC